MGPPAIAGKIMSAYGGYVWMAYGVSFVGLCIMGWQAYRADRQVQKKLRRNCH